MPEFGPPICAIKASGFYETLRNALQASEKNNRLRTYLYSIAYLEAVFARHRQIPSQIVLMSGIVTRVARVD